MCNARGGIECDFTVTRVEEDVFSIVTGTAFGNHDLSWIRRHAPRDGSVRVSDVTARWACFALWGPRARALLAGCTTADLGDDAFPPMTARFLDVGDVPARAMRIGFVGEPGYELYARVEFGAALWRTLWEGGREHGLVAGGSRALDSLRLERGHPVWGTDISAGETPFEAGLGHLVRLDKGPFVGREALQRARAARAPASVRRRLVLEDPHAVALGREPVRVDGTVLSRVTSGGYGYTAGRSIAYAYLPADLDAAASELHVEVEGAWVPAEVESGPLHRRAPAEAVA
jgi:4-methylaminobutanoate oxidase (formaldehyde-forming)